MRGQRIDTDPAPGAEIDVRTVVIPMEQFMQEVTRRGWEVYIHSGVPGTRPPDQFGQTRTFPALKDENVVSVCRKYLDVLSRLVSDFEQHVGTYVAV